MYIFSIFTCPSHINRIQALEKTCIPRELPANCRVYYVYGNSDSVIEHERNLYLKCNESYEYLLDKTYHTLKYIDNFDFDYFIKLDNDIYIPDFSLFVNKIDELKEKAIDFATTNFVEESEASRTWHYSKVPDKFKVPYAGVYPDKWAQGHCCIISKEFCRKALKELKKTKLHLLPVTKATEDVVISDIMFKNKATTYEIGGLVEHLHLSIKGLTEEAIIQRHIRDE